MFSTKLPALKTYSNTAEIWGQCLKKFLRNLTNIKSMNGKVKIPNLRFLCSNFSDVTKLCLYTY